MIGKVWLKILAIVLMIALPLMATNYFLQKQSIELAFELAQKMDHPEMIESHLAALKRLAVFDRVNQARYRTEFQKTIDSKITGQDLMLLKQSVLSHIEWQTLKLATLLLGFCLLLSFFVSTNLVSQFQRLIRENLYQTRRLELFHAIENWQKFARMLVHELRAPLTPIKLISDDIVNKHRTLPPEQFSAYLDEGAELISEQVGTVEKMIENFLKFAKLPQVQKKPVRLPDLLRSFVTKYANHGWETVELRFDDESSAPSEPIPADPVLLSGLFFNLVKNAAEANVGKAVTVAFRVERNAGGASVIIQNNGQLIPAPLADKIFEPYTTSKTSENRLNLGLGLTIGKKIALDHGGDLLLLHNDPAHGVTFKLELPKGEVNQ